MRGKLFIAFVLALGLGLSGCAGVTKEQILMLESEDKNLKTQIENLNKTVTILNGKIMDAQKAGSEGQRKAAEVEQQLGQIKGELEELKQAKEQAPAEPEEKAAEEKIVRAPKIKVLSGNGRIQSAREAARMLKESGYDVEKIDKAPRSNFPRNMVYYGPDFQEAAGGIAELLGGNTISKAMTWNSMFDIIVVTGRR